jgi:flagellar assembly factor FliW
MIIKTKYHGPVEITQEEIWSFSNGIPGFPAEKQFILLALPDDNQMFTILQSVKTPELAFVLTNPFMFFHDYEFQLDDASIDWLEISDEKDVVVYVILNVKEPFEETTANLLAPVVLNQKNRFGKQVILHDTDCKTKHLLVNQSSMKEKG